MGILDSIKNALGFSQPAAAPEPEAAPAETLGGHRITEDGQLVRNEFNFNNYINFKRMEKNLPSQKCNYDTTVNINQVEGMNQLTHRNPRTGEREPFSEDRFWGQHHYDKDNYLNIASHVPEINDKLDGLTGEEAGRVIAGLEKDPDENVRHCAQMYFDPNFSQRIHAVKFGDQYEIDGGRHRVEALAEVMERDRAEAIQNGQEFDESRYNLPVTVTEQYQMPGYGMSTPSSDKIVMPSRFASQTDEYGPVQPEAAPPSAQSEKENENRQGQNRAPGQGFDLAPGSTPAQGQAQAPTQGQNQSQGQGFDLTPRNAPSFTQDPHKGPDLTPPNTPTQDTSQSQGAAPGADSGSGSGSSETRNRGQGMSM